MERKTDLIDYTCENIKMRRQIDTEKNWKELSRRITTYKRSVKLWAYARNISAVLVIPLIMAVFFLLNERTNHENIPEEWVTLSSAHGIVTKIILPDGSEVWLNSGSTLSYPTIFKTRNRPVRLSGEAYFRVNADMKSRFIVSTDQGMTVSAYGTEFNVCAYEEEQAIEATLVSGRIDVNINADVVKIERGQQVSFDKESGRFEVDNTNIAVTTAWKEGKMIFRKADMSEVMRRLARRYNVEIRLEDDELLDYQYSATFTTETLEEVLHLLEVSAPIKCKILYPEQSEDYSFTKRIVTIRGKYSRSG